MKAFLQIKALSFLLFIISAISSAQKYNPTLDSINIWRYTSDYPIPMKLVSQNNKNCGYPIFLNEQSIQFTGLDSVINGITYKKLYKSQGVGNTCLLGCIREDTSARKIHFRDVNNVESVLYDFSLKVNDSINIAFISSGAYQSGVYKLDSITNIIVKSKTYQQFNLNCSSCISKKTLSWIEGVGNHYNFLYTHGQNLYTGGGWYYFCQQFPHNMSCFLTCFSHKSMIYYDSCAFAIAQTNSCINIKDSCNYYNVCSNINELNPQIIDFSISPNPNNGIFSINFKSFNPKTSIYINVIDLLGKTIRTEAIKNSEQSINLSTLSNGLYFLQIISSGKSGNRMLVIE